MEEAPNCSVTPRILIVCAIVLEFVKQVLWLQSAWGIWGES